MNTETSPEQRSRYLELGFLVIPDLLAPDQIEELESLPGERADPALFD